MKRFIIWIFLFALSLGTPIANANQNETLEIDESLEKGNIDIEDEDWDDDDDDDDDDWDDDDDDWDNDDDDETPEKHRTWKCRKELGYQLAYGLNQNGLTRNRPYMFYELLYTPDCKGKVTFTGEAAFRGWYDFVTYDNNIEVRSLFGDWKSDCWSFKAGYQEVAWGETFGVYIMDIVNPRDLTDPFFNELAWIRLAVFSFNLQLYNDPWYCQLIVTPIPRNNWFPREGTAFDVLSRPPMITLRGPTGFCVDRYGKDMEYGGRIGYLFESGLDVTAYYYRHWNRDPVYRLGFDIDHFFFKPILRRVDSVGASFSKAYEETVLRGDSILHIRTPWTDDFVGNWKKRNVWRTILGIDRQFEDDLSIGLQYHFDKWKGEQLHYLSTQLSYEMCEGEIAFQIFVFKGLNNHDLWVQPLLNWYINDTTTFQIRVDLLDGQSKYGTFDEGFIGPFECKSRMFIWITKSF